MEKASFDHLNRLFGIISIERHYQTLLSAWNLLAVVREPQPYVLNILSRRLPMVMVPGEHFVLKDLPFYEMAREADAKACHEHLDQREKKMQEGTLRKALGEKGPGEKGRDSSPAVRPPAAKKKKKNTIAQALQIVSPIPNLSSSSFDSAYNRSDNPTLEPEDTSSFPQLETFHLGPGSSQPQLDFVGLRVVHEPEEVRDMNNLKTGFLQRHSKRLYDPIDLASPPTKRVYPERDGKDPTTEVPLSATTHPNEASSSAAATVQPNTTRSDTATTARPDPTFQGLAQRLLLN